MNSLQIFSIIIEAIIVLYAVFIGVQKKLPAAWAFALTFLIYVIYDLSRLIGWNLDENLLTILFFVATLSALLGIWLFSKAHQK